MRCVFFRYSYKIVPIKAWQAFCIRQHFATCPRCREEFFAEDFPGPIGITADKVQLPGDPWTNIKRQILEIQNPKQAPARIFKWKWAAAVSAAVILLLIVPFILLKKNANGTDSQKQIVVQNREIIIQSIKIEDQPARVFYFQPTSKDRLIVWVKK